MRPLIDSLIVMEQRCPVYGNEPKHTYEMDHAEHSGWLVRRGRGITIVAKVGSHAALRSRKILHDVQKVLATLRQLLGPSIRAPRDPIRVYATDSPLIEPDLQRPLSEWTDAGAGREAEIPLVLEVRQGSLESSISAPVIHDLLVRWLGSEAAADPVFISGVAGIVAARLHLGLSVEEADRSVLEEIAAGRPASLLLCSAADTPRPTSPRETSREPERAASDSAAVSFVAFLVSSYGGEAIQKYLLSYDPDRPDRAAVKAFQQPLGVLEEAWLRSLHLRAENRDPLRILLANLLPLLKPYRRQQIEILVLLTLASACNVTIPLVVKWFLRDFQAFVHHKDADPSVYFRKDVLRIVATLAGIYLLSIFVSLRRTQAVSLLNQNVLNDLQLRMFARLQRLSHSFHARVKLGDIMSRLTEDLDNVRSAISQLTNKSVYQTFVLVGGVIGLLFATGFSILTLLVLSIVPMFALVYARLRTFNKAASRDQRQRVGQSAAAAQEYLSAQAVIKAFGMEERVVSAYQNRIQAQKRSKLRLTFLSALTDLSEDMATGVAQVMIFGFGGYLILVRPETGLRVEDLVASLLLLKYVIGPVAALSGVGQTLNQASGSMERVNELFEEPLTISDRTDAVELPPLSDSLVLEGVSFGYEEGNPVLEDLWLRMPAGANVAIVGPSGSGKSTIMNLLLRFWDPIGGRVLFDGRDLREGQIASLRGQIGVVLQDSFIFDSTVRENIAIGWPQATDAEITAAAVAAQLDPDIREMPHGYDTVLGERGVRMSGGQRQRLAIARAILRDPRILILDEATSALDAQTEAEFLRTLGALKQGRTVISVTHRLSWAKEADIIYVLDGGRVVEQGCHSELASADGLYAALYREQVTRVAVVEPAALPA